MFSILAILLSVFALGASPAGSAVEVETQRFSGGDRYATAAAAALATFPGGSNNIILASGENYPDGLAAAFLSGAATAPVLLTARDSLPASTANAIGTLDALTDGEALIHIVGGTAAIGAGVRANLTGLGYDLHEIGGGNRYQTAANVAVYTATSVAPIGNFDGQRTAIVTTGENFPDALSAGSLAQAGRHPVLLTASGALSPETDLTLAALNIQRVIILGGTSAVSADVATTIEAKGIDVIRVSGANRFATAAELAELLTTPEVAGGAGWDGVEFVLALGTNFPDALAASQVGGENEAPILLTGSLPVDTRNLLQLRANHAAMLYVMGGTSAISATTLQQAVNAATIDAPTATIEGLAGLQSFTVQYSEAVVNADDVGNYRLNNAALPAGSTVEDGTETNQVVVNLGGGTELELNDVITVNPAGGDIESLVGAPVPLTSFTVVENAPAP